jgi:hypothetical protein
MSLAVSVLSSRKLESSRNGESVCVFLLTRCGRDKDCGQLIGYWGNTSGDVSKPFQGGAASYSCSVRLVMNFGRGGSSQRDCLAADKRLCE